MAPSPHATAWRRHELVWLDEFGWYRLLGPGDARWDATALECLGHWAERDLPLVVTQQAAADAAADKAAEKAAGHGEPEASLALGLPAPARWGRRRLALATSPQAVKRRAAFPAAREIAGLLPPAFQAGWSRLCGELERLGVEARVYGSFGWQCLTGLDHVHAASDVDLLIGVRTPSQADAAAALLGRAGAHGDAGLGLPRLDGELVFGDGSSAAWREWQRWRGGQASRLLVKRLHGASLEGAGLLEAWA